MYLGNKLYLYCVRMAYGIWLLRLIDKMSKCSNMHVACAALHAAQACSHNNACMIPLVFLDILNILCRWMNE